MTDLKQFCYTTSHRVMTGLAQELQIQPNVHYRPAGYNTARVLSLRLVGINPHYLPKIRGLRLPLTMWAGLSDKQRVRIGWDGQGIIIEIPKPPHFWQPVTIEQLEQRHFLRRGIIATLGLGLQDEPRRINFQEETTAHVLISGLTRSGKTNTQRLIAWNLARNASPDQSRLLIFDVAKQGHRWSDFAHVAHLAHPIITHLKEADRVLAWLAREVHRRGTQGRTSPRLFVLIDELKALIDDSMVAADHLAWLAAVGAEFGLHLVLATQYPQIKMLGSAELKRNLSIRLCGKVDSADAAANALGLPDTGAESLQGYGDFLLRDFTGLFRLTVARLEKRHVATLPQTEIPTLDLPDLAEAHEGVRELPRPRNEPDPLEPEQVVLANARGLAKLAARPGFLD
jgi:DNA segregation ATPase FtsK/SpoIIIE-like protein